MNLAIKTFVEEKGKELAEKNLYRNFVLHCCNLFEFGVIGPTFVFKAISRMQQFLVDKQQATSTLTRQWREQREKWLKSNNVKKFTSPPRKDFSGLFAKEEPKKKEEETVTASAVTTTTTTPSSNTSKSE